MRRPFMTLSSGAILDPTLRNLSVSCMGVLRFSLFEAVEKSAKYSIKALFFYQYGFYVAVVVHGNFEAVSSAWQGAEVYFVDVGGEHCTCLHGYTSHHVVNGVGGFAEVWYVDVENAGGWHWIDIHCGAFLRSLFDAYGTIVVKALASCCAAVSRVEPVAEACGVGAAAGPRLVETPVHVVHIIGVIDILAITLSTFQLAYHKFVGVEQCRA